MEKESIQKTIQAFAQTNPDSLKSLSIHLFKTLGYNSKYDQAALDEKNIIGLEEFTGYTFDKDKSMASEWEYTDFVFQLTEECLKNEIPLFTTNNKYQSERYESYLLIAVKLKTKEQGQNYTKTELTQITREINKPFLMPVLVLFVYDDKLTLSVIDRRINKVNDQKDVLLKVTLIKDIEVKKPHRGHLDILADLHLANLREDHAITNFPQLHEAWRKVLDIKTLNKRFYQEIANWYFWAVDNVKFHPKQGQSQRQANEIAVIRLITRLIFVWFLKEKGFVPENLFDLKKIKDLLKDFDMSQTNKENNSYYKAILQNLFFATLNRPIKDRDFAKDEGYPKNRTDNDVNTLYRYEKLFKDENPENIIQLFREVPFVNGGLFDSLDKKYTKKENKPSEYLDCFTRNDPAQRQFHVPDLLFFRDIPKEAKNKIEPEEQIQQLLNEAYDTRSKKYNFVKGIIQILKSYKFTVEENTPLEEEVALDPDLLGRIFENLLAYYNPETGATARKGTGSFYTPREIVDYMVEESLLECLVNNFEKETDFFLSFGSKQAMMFSKNEGNKGQLGLESKVAQGADSLKDKFRRLINNEIEKSPFSPKQNEQILEAIYHKLKIIDPACGSGAYPMAILDKLVKIVSKLDPENKVFKTIIKAKIYSQDKEKLLKEIEDNKQIVSTMTIETAKQKALEELDKQIKEVELHFDKNLKTSNYARKLYLIRECIYGIDIQPIAVQITKLRFFLSLLIEQKGDKTAENFGLEALPNLEIKFVAANTLIGVPQIELQVVESEIDKTRKAIKANREKFFEISDRNQKKQIEKDEEKLISTLKKLLEREVKKQTEDTEKEITKLEKIIAQNEEKLKAIKEKGKREQYEKAISTAQKEIRQLRQKLQKITAYKEQIDRLAEWKPYDQTQEANFFDSEWMFGIKDGFDIVLGNPPYVQIQKLRNRQTELESQAFETYEKTGDLYSLFYEKGFQLLRQKGILAYITSNKWMRANYGVSTRKFFAEKTLPLLLIDFGNVQVFESATVDTNILLLQNAKRTPKSHTKAVRLEKDFTLSKGIAVYVKENVYDLTSLDKNAWVVGAKDIFDIKSKVESQGIPLNQKDHEGNKYWEIKINRGILTGLNEAFIIEESDKNKLIAQDPNSEGILKPILQGRDIAKWYPEFADLWLINSYNGELITILYQENIDFENKRIFKNDNWHNVRRIELTEKKNQYCINRIDVANDYHAIYEYLEKYQEGLKKRLDKGNHWSNLRSCDYDDEFLKPKIIYPNMTKYMPFVYDEKGFYCNDKAFIMTGKHLKYLTCFFNSKLFKYCFSDNFPELQGGTRELRKVFFDKIPVKPISATAERPFEDLVDTILVKKAKGEATAAEEAEIDARVFHLYGLSEQEMLTVLQSIPTVSEGERREVQAVFRRLEREKK